MFNVNAASGALGFFGEGYWYHRIYGFIFPSFKKTLKSLKFVAKTTTWEARTGNLPLKDDYTPKELLPRCIKAYPLRGYMLNAVNLSGPGFKELLATGKWQALERMAFGISFMPVGNTPAEMIEETKKFREELIRAMVQRCFHSSIWIQINISCPNTKQDHQILDSHVVEILELLQIFRIELNMVIDLKINLLMPDEVIEELWRKKLCDLITISNTIKYGTIGLGIPWNRLFWWRKNSPLARLGGGGLSGKPLFEGVCCKIMQIRKAGISIPIKASGGIFSVKDVQTIKACGADAIEFATVISLRPWRVAKMVKEAKKVFYNH